VAAGVQALHASVQVADRADHGSRRRRALGRRGELLVGR
jgi:hypothetical protein